jgi:opacity protein-like surface antigen
LRKFALALSVCTVALFATLAHAQQIDIAAGAGELYSTQNSTASQIYLPPAEKGGIYPSFTFDRLYANRFGYSAEVFTVYTDQYYNGYQKYRPLWYDANAVYAPRLAKRASFFLTAGVGGQSVLFYNTYAGCDFASGCASRVNSNHFLVHLSAGVRYNVWRRFFIRPEANYYRVFNNNDFHSGNVLRLGVSLGYSVPLE